MSSSSRILAGIGVVLAVAVIVAYAGRQEALTPGEAQGNAVPVRVLDIRFVEDEASTIRVVSDPGGSVLRTLPPGEGGFMRGVLRPLRRERMRLEVSYDDPYRLARWSDGRLTLADPGVDLLMDIAAFGATSVEAFATLLDEYGSTPDGRP
jgi:putative photosynthetic complex assembly protein